MSDSNNNYLGNPDRPVLVKESWAKRVQAATAATERDAAFYGETGRPAFALSRFYDMRPALLKSAWTQNSAGVYEATAAFIISDTGAVDTSFIFPVYWIPGGAAPAGEADETRLFVVWRGRWEALPIFPPAEAGKNYTAGDGIDITRVTDTDNDYVIKNTGLRGAQIWRNAYIESNGYLFLHPNHFQWYTGTAYDNTTLQLKTRALNVVTNIVNGKPQRELITVIDA